MLTKTTSNIVSVPLDTLILSPTNVRRTEADIADLVASIEAHGLINPLTVIENELGFEVIAGGRRLRALQQLEWIEAPVTIVDEVNAAELSLTENISRAAMSTIDILRAIHTINRGVDTPNLIAERFGIPMDRARKVVRLSCLAPEVLDAWEAGDLKTEEAEAFAASPDHDAQRAALERFNAATNQWDRSARNIREWLGFGNYEEKRQLAFVGRDTYEAQGGGIETDLFGGSERVLDPELLQQLADAKRASIAAEVVAQCSREVELITSVPEDSWRHGVRPEEGDLSAPDEARVIELEALLESLDRDTEDEEAAWNAAEAELDALNDKRPMILPEGGRIGLMIYDTGSPSFYWLQRPDEEATIGVSPAEAAEQLAEQGVIPSGKADLALKDMALARLRDHAIKHITPPDPHWFLFLYARAVTCHRFVTANVTGFMLGDDLSYAKLKWCTDLDVDAAWRAFKKWHTPEKITALTGELIGMMCQTGKSDIKTALLGQITPQPWVSTEDFWSLWRKGQMLEMAQEFDPQGHVTAIITGVTQGEMRRVLHDLFTTRKCWPGLDPETVQAVAGWVPKWLRFPQEEQAE